MKEKHQTINSPEEFIGRTLGNNNVLMILTRVRQYPYLPGDIVRSINSIPKKDTLNLTELLLKEIGSENIGPGNVDRKDGAVRLLGTIDFQEKEVDPKEIARLYSEQLTSLEGPLDPMGRVFSLIEAGEVLTRNMPTRKKALDPIFGSLEEIKGKLDEGIPGAEDLRAKIDRLAQNLDDDSTRATKHPVRDTMKVIFSAPKRIKMPHHRPRPKNETQRTKKSQEIRQGKRAKNWDQHAAESELVAAIKKGDDSAFAALVHRTYSDAHRLAVRITGSYSDANDVVQNAYLRVFRSISSFRGDAKFSTWLHTIVSNAAKTYVTHSSQRSHEELGSHDYADESYDHDGIGIDELARREMLDAVTNLPKRLREVIILYDVVNMNHPEIASMLGISESASKVRLHRARKKLRENLFPDENS